MIDKTDTTKEQKKHLRTIMLKQRDEMLRSVRQAHSERICQQLWEEILDNNAQVIHSYLTMGSEINVLPLLQKALKAGLTVIVPKTLKKRQLQNLVLTDLKNMEPGIFGTYHPKDAEVYAGPYDLVIVAGLAFGKNGYRVGYGGGYYDTFLAEHPGARKIGVSFPFQILETVPVEAHDVRLDTVLY